MAGSNMAVDVMVRLKDRLSGPLGRLKGRLNSFAKFLKVTMVGAAAAFTAALTGSILEAIKFQRLWDEANKTLQMSSKELNQLAGDLDKLSFKIPLTRQEFVEMAEQAGNIGIRGRENLVEFIELAAIMGKTFDGVDPKQGAKFLGNWRESLKYTHAELTATVDQINYLGNTTNAGAGPLAKFASDSLALGDAAGYAREETLALGAAVIAAGKAPEVATTGFRAMNRFLTTGTDGLTSAQQSIVSNLGLDMDQIQKQMQTDATGAIRSVVEAINKMPIEKRNSIVTKLFGDEAQRVFGPILTDVSKLEAALARIDDLRKNSKGSAMEEFLGISDNVAANWRKLLNVFSSLRESAGKPYLEPINDGLKFMIDLLTSLDERVTIFDRISSTAGGFLRGLGFSRARNGARRLWDSLEPVKDFLFGTKGGDPGEALGKMFARAESAGRKLRNTVSGLASDALVELSDAVQSITGLNLPNLSKLLVDGARVASVKVLAEGLTALRVAGEGLKALGGGFLTGFMDNLNDGLAGWDGLGTDLSALGTALGDLYASIKKLVTIGDTGMSGIESFGQLLGTLAAGGVGVAGESLKLVLTVITGLATGLTEISNWMQGEPIDWNKLKGSGFDILSQIGDLINAILEPLGKLNGIDLTIDWSRLGDGLKEVANDMIDTINGLIRDINSALGYIGLGGSVSEIGKFKTGDTKPDAANDNTPGGKPGAVSLPSKLKTQDISPQAAQKRIDNAFGSVPAATSGGGDNVQKVEFAKLEHEVTSKVEVGGGVHVKVEGPARVTGTSSSNPNAPVTANTGRALGRN